MTSDVPLDYAVFQLSPKRSRCELFVSYDGTTEKLASGLVKPFVSHLKVAEEQVALAVKSIKLEVERYKNADTWFTKGTLERFVRFVSTPEVLEIVNTLDAEMCQLEAARKIYSQGLCDDQSSASGGDGAEANAAFDATKRELLRAIDVRLAAVNQDLSTACTHASAAGFNMDNVSELQHFADRFGAYRLSEACNKFIEISQRRTDLFNNINNLTWKSSSDQVLRSSVSSDMSLDSSSGEQPKFLTGKVTFPLRRFSREPSPMDESTEREYTKDKDKTEEKSLGPTTSTTSTTESESSTHPSQTPQLARRLSVQERISMFESKQKENSPSTSTPPVPAGMKSELRRLSLDVSTSDKAVLRRWSGASDMSIDVSGERKELDSSANTPTPTSCSSSFQALSTKSTDRVDLKGAEEDKGLKDSNFPVKAKFGTQLEVSSDGGLGPASGFDEHSISDANLKIASASERSSGSVSLKKQSRSSGGIRSRVASFDRSEDLVSHNQLVSAQTQFESQLEGKKRICSADTTISKEEVKNASGGGSESQQETSKGFGVSDDRYGEVMDIAVKDQSVPRSHFRPKLGKKFEIEVGSPASEMIQNKGREDDSLPESRYRPLQGEAKKVGVKDFENQAESFSLQHENSGSSRSKFQGHVTVSKQGKRFEDGSKEASFGFGSDRLNYIGNNELETQETFPLASIERMDQAQRRKQSKGSQGLNDELKIKANELEKLFAEHKLRAPKDQSNSVRRTRLAEAPKEQKGFSVNRKPVLGVSPAQVKMEVETSAGYSNSKFNTTPSTRTADNQDYDVTPKHIVSSLSFTDDSRGKLYQKYMKKRDSRLREEWSSNRAEKEAKIKAMQDSLEKGRTEMITKLAGSAEKRNSAQDVHRRAEKIRSFGIQSAINREQLIDSFMSEEDENQGENKYSDAFLEDNSSRNAQSKKYLLMKNAASSIPRNPVAPVPRSSGKVSTSAAGRRRLNSDNPLAQSVPNLSDLRKENTKPSSAGSKPVRSRVRTSARKNSISEDLLFVSDEKSRGSHSLKKNTAEPVEWIDSRIPIPDDVNDSIYMVSKCDKEDENYDMVSKHMESKPSMKKSNSAGCRSKASVMIETVRNVHDINNVSFDDEDMIEEHDDFENNLEAMNDDKERLIQESDKSSNSGYENGNVFSFPQAGAVAATELPASIPSVFRSIQDSPGESPGSWNSPVQNPYSFSHEISDIDASDSPFGSPAWNFHSLTQTEVEAARMRKKWGAAQKPISGADSSHNRKDVTKGLKRFLKFGRKNRGSESLADWISATTSEGDDDTEDGRDLAYRSSDDLRKSRMAFLYSHHSDDGFNESDLFNEQVHGLQSSIPTPPATFKLRDEHFSGSSLKAPKSFFSLSNFRSKGSDSRPR